MEEQPTGQSADNSPDNGKLSVRITVYSVQDGQEAPAASYRGEYYPKGRSVYIRYEEKDELHGPVRTTIRWNGDEISLIRRGGVESEQTFAAGAAREGRYRSPHLAFRLSTETEEMTAAGGQDEGLPLTLAWTYRLRVEDQLSGRFQLRLHIQEDTHS